MCRRDRECASARWSLAVRGVRFQRPVQPRANAHLYFPLFMSCFSDAVRLRVNLPHVTAFRRVPVLPVIISPSSAPLRREVIPLTSSIFASYSSAWGVRTTISGATGETSWATVALQPSPSPYVLGRRHRAAGSFGFQPPSQLLYSPSLRSTRFCASSLLHSVTTSLGTLWALATQICLRAEL